MNKIINKEQYNMFNETNTKMIKRLKTKVNLTINPQVYKMFKDATENRLQPKSWVIERMMKSYISETTK